MKKAQKVQLVKLMHEIMLNMNNEGAYQSWIYTVPDCPLEDDFDYIASDNDLFNETIDDFIRIFNRYKKSGLLYGGRYQCITEH